MDVDLWVRIRLQRQPKASFVVRLDFYVTEDIFREQFVQESFGNNAVKFNTTLYQTRNIQFNGCKRYYFACPNTK